MPQVIAPPLAGFTMGSIGVKILAGSGDPNIAATDNSASDLSSSGIGSLFLRIDGSTSTTLYVKTALPNTWTPK